MQGSPLHGGAYRFDITYEDRLKATGKTLVAHDGNRRKVELRNGRFEPKPAK